jgi:hypothetical protein
MRFHPRLDRTQHPLRGRVVTADCTNCGARQVACEVKRWLSGRPCCEHCDYGSFVATGDHCAVIRIRLRTFGVTFAAFPQPRFFCGPTDHCRSDRFSLRSESLGPDAWSSRSTSPPSTGPLDSASQPRSQPAADGAASRCASWPAGSSHRAHPGTRPTTTAGRSSSARPTAGATGETEPYAATGCVPAATCRPGRGAGCCDPTPVFLMARQITAAVTLRTYTYTRTVTTSKLGRKERGS